MSRRTLLQFAAVSALWGASYLFIKVAIEDVFSPATVVCLRTLLAAAVLLPAAKRTGRLGDLRARAGTIAVLALVQVAAPFLLISYGELHISSSLAGILVASAPIYGFLLTAIASPAQRASGIAYGGVAVGIAGVVLLLGVDVSGGDALLGALMVALAGLGYALGALHLKRTGLDDLPPIVLVTATMGLSGIVTAPIALTDLPDAAPSLEAIGSLLALGALGTGVAFVFYYALIHDLGAPRAMLVAYVAPGFAVIYGAVLLAETITVSSIIGLVLILAGSWVAANDRLPRRRAARTRHRYPDPA